MPYLTSLIFPVSTVTTGYNSSVTNTQTFSGNILVKKTGGFLLSLTGYTSAAYEQYIQVYDKSAYPPVTTDRPVSVSIIPAQANFNLSFGAGLPLSNGILIVCSNTPVRFTSGGDTTYFTAVYK
jgi:hypothetical protein